MSTAKPPQRLVDATRERIRALRVKRGLTQEQLCERAGISVDAVSRIEGGSRAPTLETLEKLADALSVRVVDLLGSGALPRASHPPQLARIVTLLQREPTATLAAAEEMLRVLLKVLRAKARPVRRRSTRDV